MAVIVQRVQHECGASMTVVVLGRVGWVRRNDGIPARKARQVKLIIRSTGSVGCRQLTHVLNGDRERGIWVSMSVEHPQTPFHRRFIERIFLRAIEATTAHARDYQRELAV